MLSLIIITVGLILTVLTGTAYPIGHGGIPQTLPGCLVCHDFANGFYNNPSSGNLRWIRSTIEWPEGTIHNNVTYTLYSGTPPCDGTMADGEPTKLDGVCEVCHTTTDHHTGNIDDGEWHYDGNHCTDCHPHFFHEADYFAWRYKGPQSHDTHLKDEKGPKLDCKDCHYYDFFNDTYDFSLFYDSKPLATTIACNACHSPGGAYNGVNNAEVGGKPNWEAAIYRSNGYELKDGKEEWCVTCHDNGSSIVEGVAAPNVAGKDKNGDGTNDYGYYISGHGRNPLNIKCGRCHDLTLTHTDGNPRTYAAANNNYKTGYRLIYGMAVPRDGEYGIEAYELCFECHRYPKLFGAQTNFRDDVEHDQLHYKHLESEEGEGVYTTKCWDSDYDGTADSAMSCTSCHQVHGSPMVIGSAYYPNPKMINHGELINKEPAFDFHWYDISGNFTTSFEQSAAGGMKSGEIGNLSYNDICWGCHGPGVFKYYRTPELYQGVTIEEVTTTDLNDNPKTIFTRGNNMKIHVKFTIEGPRPSYFARGYGKLKDAAGTVIRTLANKDEYKDAPNTYEWAWTRSIPTTAAPGPAKAIVSIEAYETAGGIFINKATQVCKFTIKKP
jgi:hypothetical protein